MARVRKPQPTLDALLFSTPEQRVLRLLLSEPTTSFTPRVISSKLKGVRGLGGAEGIMTILHDLQLLGLVDFMDNQRAVRLHDESTPVYVMKSLLAICDLENLKGLLEPVASRMILFGDRAHGKAQSDGTYDLYVVTDSAAQVQDIVSRHPLQKLIELTTATPDEYSDLEKDNPRLYGKITRGLVLLGPAW